MEPLPPDVVDRVRHEIPSWARDFGLASRLAEAVHDHLASEPMLAADAADQLAGLLADLGETAGLSSLLDELLRLLPPPPE